MRQDHGRFYDLNAFLRKHCGERVQKISVDAGLDCPNRDGTLGRGGCIYCNPKGSGTGALARGESITEQILHGKAYLGKRYKAKKFLAYFQSYTNTYASSEKLEALWNEALSVPGVVGLSIGTRPDCVDETILSLLQSYVDRGFLVWIEYGLQTIHDKTLEAIHRGHDFASFERAVALTSNRGIFVCAHVILGLPGENREMMLETAKKLASMEIQGIKIHLLYVVRGTPLELLYKKGLYFPMEEDTYVETLCDFLELLPPSLVIQRLTGDPHENELVAPSWALDKERIRNRVLAILDERDTRQGSAFCVKEGRKNF